MPGTPTPHLVVGQTALAFAIFERALNPKALPLHLHQPLQGDLRRGIAQRVLDFVARAHFPRRHQMPETSLLFIAIPQPHALMQRFYTQLSSRPATSSDFLPTLGGLSLHPAVHALTGALRFETRRLFAPGRCLLRY